jgi:hypothetical protein
LRGHNRSWGLMFVAEEEEREKEDDKMEEEKNLRL